MTYRYWRILSAADYAYCSICGTKLGIENVYEGTSYNGVTGQRQVVYKATVVCPRRPPSLIWFVQFIIGHSSHFHDEMFVAPSKGPGERILVEAVK